MLCAEYSLVKHSGRGIHVTPLYCRSWSCDICAPKRRRQLIALGMRGKPDTFITLTSHPNSAPTVAERAHNLSRAWAKIVKRAKKKWSIPSIPYLAVFEATKRGEPHLHIICRSKWLPQKWLSQQMRQLTGAPIVDIRRIYNTQLAIFYVTKYVGKEPHRFPLCKRYWRTQDYELPSERDDRLDPEDDPTFKVERMSQSDYVKQSLAMGFTVEWDGDMATLRYPCRSIGGHAARDLERSEAR